MVSIALLLLCTHVPHPLNDSKRNPAIVGVGPDDESAMNHGMYFWHASKEGLINKGESIHAGIRNNLVDANGYEV